MSKSRIFIPDSPFYQGNPEDELKEKKTASRPKKEELVKRTSRKEGMDLEIKIANKWNSNFNKKKVHENKNPKIDLSEVLEKKEVKEDSPSTLKYKKAPVIKATYGQSKEDEARRQVASGALWYAKGDIKLDQALMEVKERGTMNARGEKTITIPKKWLVKQKDEAFQEGKPFWYLAFAYKNDDEVYLIKSLDHEMEMVQDLRRLESENNELRNKINNLKKEN